MIDEPYINVICDKCNDAEPFDMTALAGHCWDNRNLTAKLKRAGWKEDGDIHTCPDCIEEEENS